MIEIKNLCKSYGEKEIYKDFSLKIPALQITSLMGPSGCGKTTLLRILAGLEGYEGGTLNGLENQKVAYVFQEDRLMPWLTVRENIEYVLKSWQDPQQYTAKVEELLAHLQLMREQNERIKTLSGGMKRRVALGRALAYEADVMLMDEPFKGLDSALKRQMIEWILEMHQKRPFTLICVTHDLEEAKALGMVIDLTK